MSRLRLLALAAVALLASCAFTGSATAKTHPLSPVADCKANDGTLTQHFTDARLKQALGSISSSVKEYTTCYATIKNQLDEQLGTTNINPLKTGQSGGGGSGTLILIVAVVVVILLGGGGAFWAYRRNQQDSGGSMD